MMLIHGGDWAGFQQEYGSMPLDFSANISPLGLPEGVREALVKAAFSCERYPDPLCRALCGQLALRENLPEAFILCGNGAADLIYRAVLAKRPRRALLAAPTFAEYAQALELAGCCTERFVLSQAEDFRLTEEFLRRIVPGVEMVFLCEPNNPTGILTPRGLLERILEQCCRAGALLVVDECFLDFVEEPEAHTMAGFLAGCPNLLILKAFTKLYAMAGVRLGYALCADRALLDGMRAAGQPWAVSELAQQAGIAALQETEYVRRVRALVSRERPRLARELETLGLRVFPGEANYLMFYGPRRLDERLREKGVLIRSCANYPGLGSCFYRTAVRTPEENRELILRMREVL